MGSVARRCAADAGAGRMTLHLSHSKETRVDLLSGLALAKKQSRLRQAIETAVAGTKGKKRDVWIRFLETLHAEGFDVVEIEGGAVKAAVEEVA